jgi:hypothetical protein
VDIQTELYFDDFLGRSLGLLVCCVLFHVEPTVWRGSRQLSATCHLLRAARLRRYGCRLCIT